MQNAKGYGIRKIWTCILTFCCCFLSLSTRAQDLAPRAYLITPVHSNAVTLSYAFFSGELLFDGAVPITDSTAKVNVSVFSYTHSLHIFGRSANFSASLPYGIGNFHGRVVGVEDNAYRSWSEEARRHGPGAGLESRGHAIRPNQAGQLRNESLGFQTGTWIIAAMGTLGSR